MGVFDNVLRANESVFSSNDVALDYDYVPDPVKCRESEQQYIANTIKPLFSRRNGKNIFIHGPPGIGKTVVVRNLFKQLDAQTEEIEAIYINCWQKNTTFKIMLEICEHLGYRFTQNKKTEELFAMIKSELNKKSVVFCFDEVDKVEDHSFLYTILEEVYRKTIIIITNYKVWLQNLDDRIRSRLIPDILEFKPYSEKETREVLEDRTFGMKGAFCQGVWQQDAFDLAVKKTFEIRDVRTGLFLLKESGNCAEEESSKKIMLRHVEKAVAKLNKDFSIKDSNELEGETQMILELVKKAPNSKIGDLYKLYQDSGGEAVYKTFQRKIKKLSDNKFISTKKISGGPEGTTTIINPENKKLTDYQK